MSEKARPYGPPVGWVLPLLFRDNINDDTDALAALENGWPVWDVRADRAIDKWGDAAIRLQGGPFHGCGANVNGNIDGYSSVGTMIDVYGYHGRYVVDGDTAIWQPEPALFCLDFDPEC